ncbi:MAG: hypothetical protein KC931_07940 [Candidatus Omnitrophica bacterium]|nr:hypothetical protein [Candidatus Omnitrophota bacterium]
MINQNSALEDEMKKSLLSGIALALFGALMFSAGYTGAQESDKDKPAISPGEIRFVAMRVKDVDATDQFLNEKLGFEGQRMGEFHVYEVSPGQYLALTPYADRDSEGEPNMVVGFDVGRIDDYFKQVTEKGVKAIDHLSEDLKALERPVYRQWGAREFAVQTPDGDILVFSRLP